MKRTNYIIIVAFLLLFVSVRSAFSVPAKPGYSQITQPDGRMLLIQIKGDEYHHAAFTSDGFLIKSNPSGFYEYANVDSTGKIVCSGFKASNPEMRSQTENLFLKSLNTNEISSRLSQNTILNRIRKTQQKSNPLRATTSLPPGLIRSYPATGTPKSLVILVNFKDVKMKTANVNTAFNNLLNLHNYSLNGHVGSVRDYYSDNSSGVYVPEFVVVGPVQVSHTQDYYGGNDEQGNDLHPTDLIYEACSLADSQVDFSQFDYDNDGYVDNVYVFYAGKGEADGGGENTIWPHSFTLGEAEMSLFCDGKQIDAYACSGELDGSSGALTGIGTFTHEYGHILGLPDMYDVDYEKYNGEAFDLNYWSLMASGAYNNNSATPPCLTLPERYLLGWANPEILNSPVSSYQLTDWESTVKGCKIETSNPGEYYLLENRQTDGSKWDQYLPYHGMLIYHMDLREDESLTLSYWGTKLSMTFSDMWHNNMVNAVSSHQCCDIVEADNTPLKYTGANSKAYLESLKGDPFPGTSQIMNFTDLSTPSMKTWAGFKLEKPLSKIDESNKIVRFNFMKLEPPIALSPTETGSFKFRANWSSPTSAKDERLDVFRIVNNDTVWVNGYKNKTVTGSSVVLDELDDNVTYYYRIKANYSGVFSDYSDQLSVTTTVATSLQVYSRDKTIYIKGLEKGMDVQLYSPDGVVRKIEDSNQIPVATIGLYVIKTSFHGSEKHFKVLVK